MDKRAPIIGVIGGGQVGPETLRTARALGAAIAAAGATLVCGGLGGVMAAACQGAKEAGGRTIGVLPGLDVDDANEWVDVPIATGLGDVRNVVIVRTADACIAVDGRFGTLTELSYALLHKKPVVGLGTWRLEQPDAGIEDPIERAGSPAEAVQLALARLGA
jgi:uncharacterized protein (TIGR00725 family)